MKDSVSNDIGAKNLEDRIHWSTIDWTESYKKVKNLRHRIYRATKEKDWNNVRSLTKLMMRSQSNLFESVRKVTQDNAGKKTAGIDKRKALTSHDREKLCKELKEYTPWKAKPTKRLYIPKANGKKRPLGIPTIRDRAMQAIVKNALEPIWEAQFENNSYGFRPGRRCHDAIEQIWYRLNGHGKDEWVLDADIKGAFDNIDHKFILRKIKHFPGRELIKQWLKAGYVEQGNFFQTKTGTPQGGVISPLLANIALDGLEEYLSKYKIERIYETNEKGYKGKVKKRIRKMTFPKYSLIRYADDFIVTSQNQEDIEEVVPIIENWLSQRGLVLNKDKTKIVQVKDGFDFLGFNIRTYKGKCLIKPSKDKVLSKLREVKEWLRKNPGVEAEAVIRHLNPILRGWGNYYQHSVAKEIFAYFDHRIVQLLYKWAKRKHHGRKAKWIRYRYFGRVKNDHWVFYTKTVSREGKPQNLHIFRTATIPITRHTKVKLGASPDDPALKEYWIKRSDKECRTRFAKGSKLYNVAQNQNWKCPVCSVSLINGMGWDTHHVIPIKDGGTDEESNLVHIHKPCHKNLHLSKA